MGIKAFTHSRPPTSVGHWPAASLSAASAGTLHEAVALGRPKGLRPPGHRKLEHLEPCGENSVSKTRRPQGFVQKSWRPICSNDPNPPVLAEWPASDATTQIFASQIGWPGPQSWPDFDVHTSDPFWGDQGWSSVNYPMTIPWIMGNIVNMLKYPISHE